MRLMKLVTTQEEEMFINPTQFVLVMKSFSERTIVETTTNQKIVKATLEEVAQEWQAAMSD